MKNLVGKLFGNKLSVKEKALKDLEVKEQKFIKQQENVEPSWVNQKLEGVVPKKLQETLNQAFKKAFELVFEKGNAIIEKTYNKEEQEKNYQVNAYASKIKQDKKAMAAFSKQAGTSRTKNLVISSVEGIGLGALGVGLPDIPLFTGLLLKSIYEIALSYGFSYEEEVEQIFILQLIETALLQGEDLIKANKEIDDWIEQGIVNKVEGRGQEVESTGKYSIDKKKQIEQTARALSKALLYMKFIQGIPIIGIVGGIADTIYLNRITTYVHLKYKRRFLKSSEVSKSFERI